MNDFLDAKKVIDTATNIAILTHVRPDGDAIGSMTGLAKGLRKYGKKVYTLLDASVPLAFKKVASDENFLDTIPQDAELLIIVDVGEIPRVCVKNPDSILNYTFIGIDHHPTNPKVAHVNILHPSTSSTCEIVLDFLRFLEVDISQDIAQALLMGLLTDTRFLSISSVSSATLANASFLVEHGGRIAKISRITRQSKTEKDLQILARAVSSTQFDYENGIGWMTLSQKDFNEVGTSSESAWSAGIFSHILSVDGLVVSAHFMEIRPNTVTVEFRSYDDYDVGALALSLGGGGHKNASGVTIENIALSDAQDMVLKKLRVLVENTHPGQVEDDIPEGTENACC